MSARAKPASIRFYVDADLLGLAKVLVQVRSDVTFPGDPGGVLHRRERPACVIASTEVLDTVWIPSVAEQGWLIVSRDSNLPVVPKKLAETAQGGPILMAGDI